MANQLFVILVRCFVLVGLDTANIRGRLGQQGLDQFVPEHGKAEIIVSIDKYQGERFFSISLGGFEVGVGLGRREGRLLH